MARNEPGDRIGAHRTSNGARTIRFTEFPGQRAVCDRLARFEFEQSSPNLHLEIGAHDG
jgi:hypothetical protein